MGVWRTTVADVAILVDFKLADQCLGTDLLVTVPRLTKTDLEERFP